MSHYLERFDAFFDAYTGPMPRAMYHDSYEYRCDWASDLFAEFEKRRGYRLQEHLEVFLGDSGSDEQARLKGDYRETLSDMALDNGIRTWSDWARRGCITATGPWASPGNLSIFTLRRTFRNGDVQQGSKSPDGGVRLPPRTSQAKPVLRRKRAPGCANIST